MLYCHSMTSRETMIAHVVWSTLIALPARGRSSPSPYAACEATAIRLGKKKYVQGSDCPVSQEELIRVGSRWYGPVDVKPPTREDDAAQVIIDARTAARDKAKPLGMTDEELAALRQSLRCPPQHASLTP